MRRLPTLITINDGMDTRRDSAEFHAAVEAIRRHGVFHLSVGIGESDVDHVGLTLLAELTGGCHVVALGSHAVAAALRDVTSLIVHQLLAMQESEVTETSVQVRGVVAAKTTVARAVVDAYVLIDNSGSMFGVSDDGTGDPNKMPRTKSATVALIDSLRSTDDEGRSLDRVGLARFSDDYESLVGFTSDFSSVKDAVRAIGQGGGTALYSAIAKAARSFS